LHKRNTQKKPKTQHRQSLVYSPFITSSQETDEVYSFNPAVHMGPRHWIPHGANMPTRDSNQLSHNEDATVSQWLINLLQNHYDAISTSCTRWYL